MFMSRTARLPSTTGFYHVILRGINRQRIFEEDEDYERFLFLLDHYKTICGYELYAYCLMPNHIHILIKEGKEALSTVFRRIGTSFVYWYNLKYERSGHLFQDRYKSEAVEDDAYFLAALRYIHRNPVKAGLCNDPGEYPYSSFPHYFDSSMIDSEFALGLLGKDAFILFNEKNAEDTCMDIEEKPVRRITDGQLKRILAEQGQCENVSQFQALPEDKKTLLLQLLLSSGGSIRQVSRLTGTSFGIVRKYG